VNVAAAASAVLLLEGTDHPRVAAVLAHYGLRLTLTAPGAPIPGSYWGESEAGLQGVRLYARPDTPLHSVLHEAAHFICMTCERRGGLDRDAGGDDAEESAVCYLQLLLVDELPGIGRERLAEDMDRWGYSFRLGDTRSWFSSDAADARAWLVAADIIDPLGRLTGRCRRRDS